MKLSFNLFGAVEVWSLDLDLNHKADVTEVVVREVEKRGLKLAGKVVDRFSTGWMKLWVSK